MKPSPLPRQKRPANLHDQAGIGQKAPMPALFHFSEDPSIAVFTPHVAPTSAVKEPLVWAVDEDHKSGYWFPRDCPRACCWIGDKPLTDAGSALIGFGGARRLHAIESGWLERMRACQLYVYRFDPVPFTLELPEAGFWCARETVRPLSVEPVGDLLNLHAEAGIELRLVPTLWPIIDAIVPSGLEFSITRARNAQPRP
jgi:hypothetical protein